MMISAPVINQSLNLRLDVDGVGVYFGEEKKNDKEKINLLPCVSLSQSENSRTKESLSRETLLPLSPKG